MDGRWCLVEAAQLVAVGDLHELEGLVGGGGIDKITLIYAIHSHGPPLQHRVLHHGCGWGA